jgi:hypothetical protein
MVKPFTLTKNPATLDITTTRSYNFNQQGETKMQRELFSINEEVIYNGKKFSDVRGKRVRIDKIFEDEGSAVCSFNGDGYILALDNLSKPKGTDKVETVRDFSDARRKDGRRRQIDVN